MKRFLTICIAAVLGFAACENVEDGYRIDYPDSPSNFLVTLQTPDRAIIGDSITFLIKAESEVDIKSLLVATSASGGANTGFEIPENSTDPLIDHVYGTIQPGTRSFELYYHYVVDSFDATIQFTLIDDYGKKAVSQELYTIPPIVRYENVSLYTKNKSLADGFSTIDGVVYYNLSDYADVSAINQTVQESLDIVFLMNGTEALLAAPYSGFFSSGMSIKNKTLFKAIDNVESIDFKNLTDAEVSQICEDNVVKKGSTQIGDLKVGDIVGFRTDFASVNPYHYGLLKINSMHPTNVDHYEGVSYVIEMDIITQK